MKDWNNIDDRRAATLSFRNHMEAHPDDKQRCINDPSEAKRQFATIGKFFIQDVDLPGQETKPANVEAIQIPAAVEFRVYGATDQARHNLAVLVLPSSNGGITTEPANILIAAWPVWGPRRQQIVELENQLAMLRGEEIAELENELALVREELAAKEQSPAGPP